jgi:hypothetical protein
MQKKQISLKVNCFQLLAIALMLYMFIKYFLESNFINRKIFQLGLAKFRCQFA